MPLARKNQLVKPSGASRRPAMPDPMIRFERLPEALLGRTTLNELNTFMEALDHESDRGLVLTVAAICDDLCKQWLQEVFAHGNRKVRDALFDHRGALGTFANRTKTLYALGKIQAQVFSELEKVRELRNLCAHEWATFRFTPEIQRDFVDPLYGEFVRMQDEPGKAPVRFSPQHRMRFIAFRLILALSRR